MTDHEAPKTPAEMRRDLRFGGLITIATAPGLLILGTVLGLLTDGAIFGILFAVSTLVALIGGALVVGASLYPDTES